MRSGLAALRQEERELRSLEVNTPQGQTSRYFASSEAHLGVALLEPSDSEALLQRSEASQRSAPQTKCSFSIRQSGRRETGSSEMFLDITTELLRCGKSVRFRAPGRSMHPTIKDGETITVEPVKPSGIKRGDIVLYRFEKGVIAHRVVRIEKNDGAPLFILRGDALGAQDEAAAVQQVLGKVVSVQRGGRSIDPYSRRAKMVRIAYVCASRLRRWMMPT